MAELANRAAVLVGAEYSLSKRRLMETRHGDAREVAAPRIGDLIRELIRPQQVESPIVDSHLEHQARRIIAHDEYRPHRHVLALDDTEQVYKRHSPCHCETQADVVAVKGVGPSVFVFEQAFRVDAVVVWSRLPLADRRSCNTDRHLTQNRRLEDPLWSDQWYALFVNDDPLRKHCPWKDLTILCRLRSEKIEDSQANVAVSIVSYHWSKLLTENKQRSQSRVRPSGDMT